MASTSKSGTPRLSSVQQQLTELQELLRQRQLELTDEIVQEEARASEKARTRGETDREHDNLREQLAAIHAESPEVHRRVGDGLGLRTPDSIP
jgi:hypothetical protein